MRVLGTFASAPMRCRQRPPVPIRPMLSRSFAPIGCADAGSVIAEVAATVAADAVKKERRETEERDMLDLRVLGASFEQSCRFSLTHCKIRHANNASARCFSARC